MKTPKAKLDALRASYAANPEKYRKRARDRRARTGQTYRNPGKQRGNRLKRRYGLTRDQYNDMLRRQGWACAICRVSFIAFTHEGGPDTVVKPRVDHDHATGAVRGLLCDDCNRGLGGFKDNIASLSGAIGYLARSK